MEKEDKPLEIIEGDGSEINMSPVSNYIISMKPQNKKSKKIIIPEEKKNKSKDNKKKE